MFMGFIMIIFIRKLNEMKFSRPLSPLSSHLLQHDFAKEKENSMDCYHWNVFSDVADHFDLAAAVSRSRARCFAFS